MDMFQRHSRGGKRLQRESKSEYHSGVRLAALLLCLSMLTGFLPVLARAADGGPLLSSIVTFDSITLHYAADDGQSVGAEVENNALLEKDDKLMLRYTYAISEEQCKRITAGTNYYLEVSPHLVLPHLESGSPLTVETEDGKQEQFGAIYADGSSAWVTFDAKENSSDAVLSDYGELNNAYFYLNCNRAGNVPADATEEEKSNNLYAMKFENNTQLNFGYAEDKPVTAKAIIEKGGKYESTNKTITWTIDYRPWQNPTEGDDVTLNTPFELRDTIDTSLHSYVEGSVVIKIGNASVMCTTYNNPSDDTAINRDIEAYVIVDTPEDGDATLTFGGKIFNAVKSTVGNPATPLTITYKTEIKDELLLPGGTGDKKVTNAADLFAGENGGFNKLNISGSKTVTIPQPTWLTKTGKTTRDYLEDGKPNGSHTDWEVVFYPNGFTFEEGNHLTLHDQLPDGSTLVAGSVKVGGAPVTATAGANNDFTISPIPTTTNSQPVTITYQTHVPEDMYNSGTSLGTNIAYFTFDFGGNSYTTPKVETPIGSGDGTGNPGTATLVKENSVYHAATRTIDWTVKINPHQAYLKGGTFTDDLKIGGSCGVTGHISGLELVNGTNDIVIKINGNDPTDDEKALINLTYNQQVLTITVEEIGAKTITLTYTTKVCDPCIFANNTAKTAFINTISTNNMIIGTSAVEGRSASADSTADVNATVLTKKAPVYDYVSGTMKWTVEVDAAGLSMTNVVLTDDLPAGMTYVENSLDAPEISGASASVNGQTLTINLSAVTGKTTVTFETAVDPEILGFGGDKPVVVENTIRMNGKADGVEFAEVSHRVQQNFSNHGLVKKSDVDNTQELIQYEVLINPYHLALPENPSLVDTLDKRLQLDTDTLRFYKANLTGTTVTSKDQKPGYTKNGTGQPLKVTGFDPDTNSFTVQLPISADNRDAYVLTYTADMIDHQAGGYSNSVRFDGGSVLLGGNKNNSAAVGGGGGGGGGGVAARKATISIIKTDSETQVPLSGVSFLLYQWDSESGARGLPFAQGTTDAQGKLSFKVKPDAVYELVESESAPGYGSAFGWSDPLPNGVSKTDSGLLITAGAAKSELTLNLTNKAKTTDIVFRLFKKPGSPMSGEKVQLFKIGLDGTPGSTPEEVTVGSDGKVSFSGLRRGVKYLIKYSDGTMTVDVPLEDGKLPEVILPDGTKETLTEDYTVTTDPGGSGGTGGSGDPVDPVDPGDSGGTGDTGGSDDSVDSETSDETGTLPADPENPPVDPENPPVDPVEPETPEKLPTELPDPNVPNAPKLITIIEDSVPKTYRKVWDSKTETWVYILDEDVPLDGADVPQTGDNTRLLAAVTLSSGVALATMTLYQFLRLKKREKK